MKKIHGSEGLFIKSFLTSKILKVMRISLTLIFLATLQLFAGNSYSQSAKLTLNLQNASIENILNEIEQQSEFFFVFNYKLVDVDRQVNIQAENKPISEVLTSVFSGSDVDYMVLDRQILLSPRAYLNDVKAKLQPITVTGTVSDETGNPIPGVTIVLKGTTQGSISDANGEYTINVDDPDATLVFSFIGMLTQEVQVGNQTSINITMIADAIGLEEVVVVGYGTARRKDISGAVSTVKLEDTPVALSAKTNILQSLRGGVTGVNIGTQNNVGETPEILVRGQNSINGSNVPLIVLDGVIFLGNISDINPSDIASIDVLKDASSAAAYGSRSANGVIMINTKKGTSDKPTIRFSTSVGANTWKNKFDLMETPRYLEKYAVQNNYSSPDDIIWDDETRNVLFAQRVNTDWLDLVSRNGLIQDHQVSVSGKSNRVNYYFSGGFADQEGVIVGDDYTRISLRSRLNIDVTEWLEIGIDGTYNNNDYSGIGASLGSATYSAPIGYPYRYDGMPFDVSSNTGTLLERWPTGGSIQSPLWGTDGTVDDIDKNDFFRFAGNALLKVPKVEGLTYRLNTSINANFRTQDRFYDENYGIQEHSQPPYFERYSASALQANLSTANGYNRRSQGYNYVIDNIINYKREFVNHYVDVILVATRDYTSQRDSEWTGDNFSANGNTTLGLNGLGFATIQENFLDIVERSNVGYLGRLIYAYNHKYHITASIRRDGASVFGSDIKWGNFSSIGVAWTVSEENFLANNDYLDYLKIKASYGQNGNQGVTPYGTLASVLTGVSGEVKYEFGDNPGEILYGIQQASLSNPTLGWEKTTSFNGGFQSAWLGNRIFLDLDFYISKTTDQIFTREIPIMTGFTSIISSLGQIDNNGIEINLRTVNMNKGELKWWSNLSYWRNRNIVAELYGDDIDGDGVEEDDIANNLFIGKSLGAIYGYEYIGIVQEDDNEYINSVGAQPGDPMFQDLDGDGFITADNDRKILGYRKENYRLGLSNIDFVIKQKAGIRSN